MEAQREMRVGGEAEGARRATGVAPAGAAGEVPDPAVDAKPRRRQFSAEYKLRILKEVDRAKGPGAIGAILRREGLYSSHLVVWRSERDRVAKAALSSRKRGPKAPAVDPRVEQLERENRRLERELAQARTIIEIQKKLSELWGIPLNTPEFDEND
jgi:transposase-like protein